ncbi:MAG: hypothetical protein AAF799_03595 [Myxococcota bacterium]
MLALLSASVANASRASLRCIEGHLVAYQGRLLPWGEEPLEGLEPLPVTPDACDEEHFEDRGDLEVRYREIAVGDADEALRTEDQEAIETSLGALDKLPTDADQGLARRYRQLIEALLQVEVQRARQTRQRALHRIEQARRAGVDETTLREAEAQLDPPPPSRPTEAEAAPAPPPVEPPSTPHEPVLAEPDSPRSL